MEEVRCITPPRELWLIFDFSNLNLTELEDAYKEIRRDGYIKDIDSLLYYYRLKKSEKTTIPVIIPQKVKDIKIPFMKKPKKRNKSELPVMIQNPPKDKNIIRPYPRQWWAYQNIK